MLLEASVCINNNNYLFHIMLLFVPSPIMLQFKENVDARHSIVEVYDKTGTDSHIFAVSFKDLVDDIIAEYYKL